MMDKINKIKTQIYKLQSNWDTNVCWRDNGELPLEWDKVKLFLILAVQQKVVRMSSLEINLFLEYVANKQGFAYCRFQIKCDKST